MDFNEKFDDNEMVTIEELAEQLIRAAKRIQEYHISIAFGMDPPDGFERGNIDFQDKILDQVRPMIREYQQTKQITANTASSVIRLLSKGKITPGESVSLLKMLREKMAVEEGEIELNLKKKLIKEVDSEGNDD